MTTLAATNATQVPSETDETPPFRRLLVAVDGSPAARGASDLATQWATQYGADLKVLALVEPSRHGHAEPAPEPDRVVAGQPAACVEVSGSTRSARNRELARAIAEAGAAFGADVILVGIDHRRLARHRMAPSLREQLARVSPLPVLVAPTAAAGEVRDAQVRQTPRDAEEAAHVPARRYAGV